MTVESATLPLERGRGGRRPGRAWSLIVQDAEDITPKMRRVHFGGDLAEFDWKPGQDLSIHLPDGAGGTVRRHYTVRAFDVARQRLSIDVFLHGDTPGPVWARNASPGETIGAQGPRGRNTADPEAAWHLFSGDETCIPAIFAIVERLPAAQSAHVFLEVADAMEKQVLHSAALLSLRWIERGGPPQPSSIGLIEALRDFDFPAGIGHAYLIGETNTVRAQRQALLARGFPKERISAEGYWRPGRVGGHDHNWD